MSVATGSVLTAHRPLDGVAYKRVAGMHMIRTAGGAYDMGHQHGKLLRDFIPDGPALYYETYVDKIIRMGGWGNLAPAIRRLLQETVGRRVAAAMPSFAKETIRGVAHGADIDEGRLLRAYTMPDSLVWLVSALARVKGVDPALEHRLALGLGCTSAIAWGGATADGKLLHARNFDYHGVRSWPRTQTVLFAQPTDGQRYVSITAAGIPMGGVTAMNEAGLTLTVHQHMFSNGARIGGTPIGVVGDEVMRKAANLDEAEAILRAQRPIGSWTYLVADGRQRDVLCFEENPARQVAKRVGTDQHSFGYANIYLDDKLGATERALYGSYWRHNVGRYRRVNQLLDELQGDLTPELMAGILGDTGAGACRFRDAMAMVLTIASVVFQPETGLVWVANGEAPTSHRRFEPFSLATMDHAPEAGTLQPHKPTETAGDKAYEFHRQAYLAYVDDNDRERALELVRKARVLAPMQSLYHALEGYVALGCRQTDAAHEAFGRALDLGHEDPQRVAGLHLWRGRCADLGGKRADAVRDYGAALELEADAPVHKAARRGLRTRYRNGEAQRVWVDFAFVDVVQP